MKGSVKLPVFIDEARKLVNTTQLRAKYLGASYEAEYCQWQTLHGLGSLMETASLIITPNAYLEGQLLSAWPPDGSGDLSVTRATTATRVNSAGLVELVPYNLLTYSEQFDNAAWTKANATVSANATTAPDGTLTADKLIPSSGSIGTIQQIHNITALQSCTMSIFAKAAGIDNIKLNSRTPDGLNDASITFDLSSGTISIAASSNGAFNSPSGTITNYGNDWYRLTLTHFTSITTSTRVRFFSEEAGDGTKGLFLWGGQFVEGTNALPYQKTETRLNIPRLDYSNGTCPSILVEPQRTNLALWSSSFDNAAWAKLRATITTNSTTAPDGNLTADKIVENTDNNSHGILQAVTNTSGQQYTVTIYAKADERNWFVIYVGGGPAQGRFFDLSNGTLGSVLANTPNASSITDVGNGWYRCSITYTATDTSSDVFFSLGISNGTNTYLGNGTSGLYLWGAQVELGSYPTSYIPTTSASVTRNADVISKTGISSLIGQTEGTLFVEFINDNNNNASVERILALSDGTANNRMYVAKLSSGASYFVSVTSGTQTGAITGAIMPQGIVKIALAYNTNDVVMYVNGSLVGSDLSHTTPVTSNLYFGQENLGTTANLWKPYNAAALWKTRLTNDQLATLTTI